MVWDAKPEPNAATNCWGATGPGWKLAAFTNLATGGVDEIGAQHTIGGHRDGIGGARGLNRDRVWAGRGVRRARIGGRHELQGKRPGGGRAVDY